MAKMTPWERVRASLRGEEPDRPALSAWRHFYHQEGTGAGLAQAMLGFQRRYAWDFMKVNPRASYHGEDWGLKLSFSTDPLKEHQRRDYPIKAPTDWLKIRPLSPRLGVLGQHLEALAVIARELQGRYPFIMTVFTPLAVAARLAESPEAMSQHLKEHPQLVHGALAAITATFVAFARECLARGAAGLFFATTEWGSHDHLTAEQHRQFSRPYDLKVLEAVAEAPFNLLHVCRSRNMLAEFRDYPVAAFNWDARDATNPSLAEGRKLTGKAVVGGMAAEVLHKGSPADVATQARQSHAEAGGERWMLGPGCTILPDTPAENLAALAGAFSEL